MSFASLLQKARSNPTKIVLPEGHDPRVIEAASRAAREGLATPVLLGNSNEIQKIAATHKIALEGVNIVDPVVAPQREALTHSLHKLRENKGMTLEKAASTIEDNLHFACMMVNDGLAAGCVAGAVYPTATVVRTAMQLVGKHPEYSFVSSFFIMLMTQPFHPIKDIVLFADCALVINPDERELAEIAVMTGDSGRNLLALEPEIAMLSFSTAGSAKHQSVTKVQKATELARKARPDWRIIGDVQLDAAVIPEILASKAPEQASDNPANILVFPTLDAGNIGYKMCERFGGAEAIGPVLQGLAKPVNDLSRGCKTEDIVNILAVTVVQTQTLSTT
ncbi:MAG: phosphate acetyltransferase [Granulosicoccus sp.]|nr:phosphate acetyltransferase [Granulosicoccus sp.]